MRTIRPRARRYPLGATVELTDLQSETRIQGRTIDLSLYGCRVRVRRSFVPETKLRIRITYGNAGFTAFGRVTHVSAEGEVGVVFTRIEHDDQPILEKWIEEKRQGEKGQSLRQTDSIRGTLRGCRMVELGGVPEKAPNPKQGRR